MKRLFLANFLKAGSLRAGFCFACCTLITNVYADERLRVGADPRLELLTVVQLLSRYPYLTPYRVNYARDAISHFANYLPHQAIALFRNFSAEGNWSDAYPTAMLYLSDPPALEERETIPEYIYDAFRGPENFARFLQALRDFAYRTDFNRFFARHNKLYLQLEYQLRKELAEANPTAEIEAYFGTRQLSYSLVLSPLLHHGGFGPHLGQAGGPFDVYTLLGPTGAERGMPRFGPRDHLLQIVWHEFSHAFVNPLSEGYYHEIERHSALFVPLSDQMNGLGYTRWLDCANEHIIRAIVARLAHNHLDPEAGRRALREESARGFRYIHALARRLEEYESHRRDYPTLAAFFPRLIDIFAELQTP